METYNLLKNNVQAVLDSISEVAEVILLSRLEVLSKDILTIEEINKFQIDVEKLKNIRVSGGQKAKQILIVVQIPNFTRKTFHKLFIAPVPNKNNCVCVTTFRSSLHK